MAAFTSLTLLSPGLLRLVLFVLPLGLDTFAVSAALGMQRPGKRDRLRISLVMSFFEMAMPLIGLALGRALGSIVGEAADYIAMAVLASVGAWMIVHEDDEAETAARFVGGRGLALVAIGISISLDELAMGFTIGLLHLPIWLAIVLIGVQAFVVAQLGLRLGTCTSEHARENVERLAGAALIGLALLLGVEHLVA
jgi:putative Mn2+ efflux pump MntP